MRSNEAKESSEQVICRSKINKKTIKKAKKSITIGPQKPLKIVVLRESWGLLGALGGLLEPSWPMRAPRANINSKKVVRWPPLAPPLGAILEPKLGLCWSMLVKNVCHNTLGKHVLSKHHF